MKQNQPFVSRQSHNIKTIFIAMFIISSIALKAQAPSNFSGKWEFDKARSDKDQTGDASFNGSIIMEIRQNSDTISFTNTYFMPGKKGMTFRPESFPADGTVISDHSGTDPAKKFIKWSQDGKILTTQYIMTATIDAVAQDFLTVSTYQLMEDGKTLFVEELRKSKLNGEKKTKKMYKKK
jgi:hypothetical protein